MLVERGLLREVGSFRSVRRYVDAQLIAAIQRAGAATYRTHGLGYLLRRNASGHTWQVDDDYLLDPARVAEIRPGFAPSRLLEYDESERPIARIVRDETVGGKRLMSTAVTSRTIAPSESRSAAAEPRPGGERHCERLAGARSRVTPVDQSMTTGRCSDTWVSSHSTRPPTTRRPSLGALGDAAHQLRARRRPEGRDEHHRVLPAAPPPRLARRAQGTALLRQGLPRLGEPRLLGVHLPATYPPPEDRR